MDKDFDKNLNQDFVRKPRRNQIKPTTIEIVDKKITQRTFSPPLILISVFIALVALGTILLMLPYAHHGDSYEEFLVGFFTATSAVTVTGLTVVDSATHWTLFGKIVIMILMFIGGLGFMSLAVFLLVILGQRVSIRQKLLIRETLNRGQMGGLQRLSIAIVGTAVLIQFVGFLALLGRFITLYDLPTALWHAAFHSVSGFNNAGFIVFNEAGGLRAFQNDYFVLGIIAVLIVLGSLSFWVVSDILTIRKFRRFSLVTKITVFMTLVLIFAASVAFYAFESNNGATIGDLGVRNQIAVAVFEGISGRTAGFSTIDYSAAKQATNLFMSLMMFIGGATGSVAGGIKLTTCLIIVLSIVAIIRERPHVTVFDKEVDQGTVRRAYAIFVISLAFVFICSIALSATNPELPIKDLLFESFSAYGTVGLSTGITNSLNPIGTILVALTMLVGRVGPLIIGLKAVPNPDMYTYRKATETVTIG